MKRTQGEKWFAVFNYVLLTMLAICTLYPFLYVLSASFSSAEAIRMGKVFLLPHGLNADSYVQVLTEDGIWMAYGNTVYYTVAGTAVSLLLTILGAYPLSKKRLRGRKFIGFFIVFTMMFHPGMIPLYLNLKELDLLNTRTGIIIPFAMSTFNVIILRTFFQSVPDELEEAARVDGGTDWQILWQVFLPLSKAALATIGLFYAIFRWNGYFWSMIILKDMDKIPLQVLLNKLIVQLGVEQDMLTSNGVAITNISEETVIYATIIVAVLPIIIVYPFIQKYFVQGTMIGSLKE